jgi:ribonuclease HII
MRVDDSRIVPTFDLEAAELALARGPVAGVDEAGRGPWAGPVVAAAVILDPAHIPDGINDSKVLEPEERERLYRRIRATAFAIGVGVGEVERIDRDNILAATMWAMAAAVGGLEQQPKLVIVDGNRAPPLRRAYGRQGRRQVPLHRRRLHSRQGHARPADGGAGP